MSEYPIEQWALTDGTSTISPLSIPDQIKTVISTFELSNNNQEKRVLYDKARGFINGLWIATSQALDTKDILIHEVNKRTRQWLQDNPNSELTDYQAKRYFSWDSLLDMKDAQYPDKQKLLRVLDVIETVINSR